MKRIFKKTLLVMMMASLMPMQAHGISDTFKAALAGSLSWAKSSCSSALASTYSAVKSYTVPTLVGLGFLATTACVADYAGNKQELDWLTGLTNQLENQRKNKRLSPIENSYKQLAKPYFLGLKKLIADYNSIIRLNNDVSEKLVFDTYAHDEALQKRNSLELRKATLIKARAELLNDPRCQLEVGAELGRRDQIATSLDEHLPQVVLSPDMSIEQANKACEKLEREINDCNSHVLGLTYKKLTLDKTVRAYLNRLREYAEDVKENIEKLTITQAALEQHELQSNNKYKEIVVSYTDLRKHLEAKILEQKELCSKYKKRCWQLPAALCGIAALAAGSFALIKFAWKGN